MPPAVFLEVIVAVITRYTDRLIAINILPKCCYSIFNMESTDFVTNQILDSVKKSVRDSVSVWYGPSARLAEAPVDFKRYRHSFMARFEVVGTRQAPIRILGKIPTYKTITHLADAVAHPVLRNNAFREYEWLTGIRQVFTAIGAGDEFCLIRPFAYLGDANAILMEEVDGQALKKAFPRPFVGGAAERERFYGFMGQAGKWLRLFHDHLGSPDVEQYPLELVRHRVHRTLDGLAQLSADSQAISQLETAFDDALAPLANRSVKVALEHGDLNCSNILIDSRGRVGPIDPDVYERGPIYSDLATLITDPCTRKTQVFGHGLYYPRQYLKRSGEACLRGYFGSQDWDNRALGVHCALACAQKWLTDEQLLQSSTSSTARFARFGRPVMRHYFQSLVLSYLVSSRQSQ